MVVGRCFIVQLHANYAGQLASEEAGQRLATMVENADDNGLSNARCSKLVGRRAIQSTFG